MKWIKWIMIGTLLVWTSSFTPLAAAAPENRTVEGTSTMFVTGESYANKVLFAGYNSREKTMYLNIDFETTKSVGGNTPTFTYSVEVFNQDAALLGKIGVDAAETVTGSAGSSTAKVTNKEIQLSSDMTVEHRIVTTVTSVVMN